MLLHLEYRSFAPDLSEGLEEAMETSNTMGTKENWKTALQEDYGVKALEL